ncbi:hypothetical protein JCM13580A_32160 [Streptomyces drozdowiczii]
MSERAARNSTGPRACTNDVNEGYGRCGAADARAPCEARVPGMRTGAEARAGANVRTAAGVQAGAAPPEVLVRTGVVMAPR